MKLVIDFETRSRADLKTVGADNYATDPSTDILCLATSIVTDEDCFESVWVPGAQIPSELIAFIPLADHIIAHNARFDQLIWECIAVQDYGFPEIPPEKWLCSAAQCRVNALPSSLDNATRAMNAKHRKDHNGTALIKKLCVPDADGNFNEDPELMRQMIAYCVQDVRATVELIERTRPMTTTELADYHCNERINDRGVCVDTYLASLVIPYAKDEQLEIADQLSDLTQGAITKHTQSIRFKNFLLDTLGERQDVLDVMRRMVDGVEKFSADKASRLGLLELPDIPDATRDIIQLVGDGNRSSVAKFQRMIDLADPDDGRVRGCFLYAGAGQTKRTSSRGLQMQNMVRECFNAEETEKLIDTMEADEELPEVMQTLSKLLRPAIVPEEGKVFVVGDWSAIEAMVLPWLSDSSGGEKVLDVFRNGEDIYVATAHKMGLTDRMIGKITTLSMGFAGGVGALQAMAKNYGLKMTDETAQAHVYRWREANPWATRFWNQLEKAAKQAVRHTWSMQKVGRVTYHFEPKRLMGTLVCTLPSGETIQYPATRLEEQRHPKFGTQMVLTYAKASITPAADAEEWPRATLWVGVLVENICQSVAGEILRHSLRQLKDVVLTVHDEIVLEVPARDADRVLHHLETTMETPPSWATEIPLKAKPTIMHRYGK
jgi:DNA polymerase